MRRVLLAIPFVFLFLLAVAVGTLNRTPLVFNYLFGQTQVTLATLLGATLSVGVVVGVLAVLPVVTRLRWRLRRVTKTLATERDKAQIEP